MRFYAPVAIYIYPSFPYEEICMKVAGNYAMHILTFSSSVKMGSILTSSYIICMMHVTSY